MANPINSNIGPHVNADTTGATALIMRAMTDPNNNVGNQLYKLYGDALDTYRTNQGTLASLEAKALFDQGKTFADVLPLMQDKYSAGVLAKAKLGDVYSGSLKDITERDTNQRGWNSDARDDVRLGYEGDRVKIAQGELDVNRGRLGLERTKYADERRDKDINLRNDSILAKYMEGIAIDPSMGPAFLRAHPEILNDSSYAPVAAKIMADMSSRGQSPIYSATAIPEGYNIKPGEINPTIGVISSNLRKYGDATGYVEYSLDPNAESLDKVKADHLKIFEKDPDTYTKVNEEFGNTVEALKAEHIPENLIAYVMKHAQKNNLFFDGFHYNKDRLVALAKEINNTAEKSYTQISNQVQARNYLKEALDPKSATNLTNIEASRVASLSRLDAAYKAGRLTKQSYEDSKAEVNANAYKKSVQAQTIIDRANKTRDLDYQASQATALIDRTNKRIADIKAGNEPVKNPKALIASLEKILEKAQGSLNSINADAAKAQAALSSYTPR